MKKILLTAVVAAFVIASCSKERTCTCVTTVQSISSTQPNYAVTIPAPTTETIKYAKVKKGNVYIQLCTTRNESQTYNYSVFSGSTTTNYVRTEIDQIDCTLK